MLASDKKIKISVNDLLSSKFQPHKLFSKRSLNLIFLLILFTNVLINVDHGSLPAITTQINESQHLSPAELGLLGSLVYFGLSVGSFIAPVLFHKISPKLILTVAILLNAGSLFVFTLPGGFATMASSRTLVGLFQVFMTIYFPVWVDLYGRSTKQKTIWMTLLQVCVPLGIVIGYGMSGFLSLTLGWRYAFYGQAVLLCPCVLLFGCLRGRYFRTSKAEIRKEFLKRYHLQIRRKEEQNNKKKQSKIIRSKGRKKKMSQDIQSLSSVLLLKSSFGFQQSHIRQDTITTRTDNRFSITNKQKAQHKNQLLLSQISSRNEDSQNIGKIYNNQQPQHKYSSFKPNKKQSSKNQCPKIKDINKKQKIQNKNKRCRVIRVLCKRPVFIFCMLGISSLYFVVTAIQFWVSDYLQNHLKLEPQFVYIAFSATSITAPTTGVIIGGLIISRIGGYQKNPRALKLSMIMAILALFCAVPIPFIQNKWAFIALLWGVLFCGGFIMPTLMGCMISSVPDNLRAVANSFAAIFFNAIGFLPAPFAYGAIISLIGDKSSNIGMMAVMGYTITGVVYVIFAYLKGDKDVKINKKRNLIKEKRNLKNKLNKNDHNNDLASKKKNKIFSSFQGRNQIQRSNYCMLETKEEEEEEEQQEDIKRPKTLQQKQLLQQHHFFKQQQQQLQPKLYKYEIQKSSDDHRVNNSQISSQLQYCQSLRNRKLTVDKGGEDETAAAEDEIFDKKSSKLDSNCNQSQSKIIDQIVQPTQQEIKERYYTSQISQNSFQIKQEYSQISQQNSKIGGDFEDDIRDRVNTLDDPLSVAMNKQNTRSNPADLKERKKSRYNLKQTTHRSKQFSSQISSDQYQEQVQSEYNQTNLASSFRMFVIDAEDKKQNYNLSNDQRLNYRGGIRTIAEEVKDQFKGEQDLAEEIISSLIVGMEEQEEKIRMMNLEDQSEQQQLDKKVSPNSHDVASYMLTKHILFKPLN